MVELCINKGAIERSDGKATCGEKLQKIRENGCAGCPKANVDFNTYLARGMERPSTAKPERHKRHI